jgi:hypothetical protein
MAVFDMVLLGLRFNSEACNGISGVIELGNQYLRFGQTGDGAILSEA